MRRIAIVSAVTLALAAGGVSAWAVFGRQSAKTLTAISATSAANAWAVGYSGSEDSPAPVIEHWDGMAWQQATLPAGLKHAYLSGVAAGSASNAWAVGYTGTGIATSALMLHWNGRSWHRVVLPGGGSRGSLTAIAATSAGRAWAFGLEENGKGAPVGSQALYWNGSRWQQMKAVPAAAARVAGPSAVALSLGGTGWAVGPTYFTRPVETPAEAAWTSAWQLTGGAWRRATIPGVAMLGNGVLAVAAAGSAAAYATAYVSGIGEVVDGWNGTAWKLLPSSAYEHGTTLCGLAALSATDAWAVGEQLPGHWPFFGGSPLGPVIMRWNGHQWTRSAIPALHGASLNAVAATSPANAWAIGQTGSGGPLILHWNGKSWTRQL